MNNQNITEAQLGSHLLSFFDKKVAQVLINLHEWFVEYHISGGCSTARVIATVISGIYVIFPASGFYYGSIFLSAQEAFRNDRLRFSEASAKVTGCTHSWVWDLLAAGLIKSVTRTYPYYYRVHQPSPTHKLTRKEIIERQMKGTALHGVERHD